MTKTMTASELLAQIEKDFFKGAGLDKASQLEGEERRSRIIGDGSPVIGSRRYSASCG